MNAILILAATPNVENLLISFLVLIVVLAVIGGLVWAIEHWISPIPPPVKMVLAIVLLILVVIWGIRLFGGGA